MKSKFWTLVLTAQFIFINSSSQAMQVQFEEDDNLPIVYLTLVTKIGAAHEKIPGILNFMGEMLLRGTAKRTKEKIDQELDQLGASLSVQVTAESLSLQGAVLSSQLEPFLELLTDLITQPSFSDNQIKILRDQLISAVSQQYDQDANISALRFGDILFSNHPYANRVMGTTASLKAIQLDDIRSYYRSVFSNRDSFLLVGTGDSNTSVLKNWTNKLTDVLPLRLGNDPQFTEVTTPSRTSEVKLQIVDKPNRTQTQVEIGQIGIRPDHPQSPAFAIGNHAFGGGSFQSRLMVEIRVKRGWSYGAGSRMRAARRPHSWRAHLFPASKDTAAAVELSLKMIQDLKSNGITESEFDFAKKSLINNSGFNYNTPQKRLSNHMMEYVLELSPGYFENLAARLTPITLPQVNQALSEVITPDRLTVSVLGTSSQIKSALAKAVQIPENKIQVVPYNKE